MVDLKVYKFDPRANIPQFSTEMSACFDLESCFGVGNPLSGFSPFNSKSKIEANSFTLYPKCRALVPTGLIFDIPEGYSLRVHPRSGIAVKHGVTVANCEGVIDADYFQQTYIALVNLSDAPFVINTGERLAQAELVEQLKYSISETLETPVQKSTRTGGLGSTGI